MTIKIPHNVDKQDYLLSLTWHMRTFESGTNYSEELLGTYMTDEKITNEYQKMNDDTKIRIPEEINREIAHISEDEVRDYISIQKDKTRGYGNNFTHIIRENQDIFDNFLTGEKGQTSYNKQSCKDLLIESIEVYKTKYNDEIYIKTDESHYKHIGNSHENIYVYFKKMYQETDINLQRYIPFSSFFNQNRLKNRTFESLEPNRHIILFNDCILDVSQAKKRPISVITDDIIPFSVIDGNYKTKSEPCQKFVQELLNKLVENPNILKAILYSLINKDELIKSAIFNIQKSGKGKTTLLDPFKQIGILITAKSKTLEKYLELETLFRQKLIVNFEEIQDAKIQGSDFNSLVDNSAITVPRKNQKAIDVPAYIKPTIIINGEDLPDFKDRTKGTLNRFSLMPTFINEITKEDADFINKNGFQIGIEMIRHLMMFILNTTKDERMQWLKSCKITEKQYLELRENKTKKIFDYIRESPNTTMVEYCISEKMLVQMIIYMQDTNILTVNLFNNETEIKRFIKQEIINGLDLENTMNDGYMNKRSRQRVHRIQTEKKSNNIHVLKYCLQPTKKGLELLEEMGYETEDLKPKYQE